MKYLSPASRKARERNQKAEQMREKRIINKYAIELDDEQHDDMCKIHSTISDVAKGDLHEAVSELPCQEARDALMKIWENDNRKKFKKEMVLCFIINYFLYYT